MYGMNYNGIDPEENLPEDIANTDEYKKPAADLPEEKAVTHHKKRFNFKIFLRSFFLTLLVAGLMLVAWRGGIFAVDYFAARRDGMSPREAAAYAWSDATGFFVDLADNVSPVMLTDKKILVIGSDKNKINADVIMLVQLNAKTKSVDIISVLRDTMVKMNGRTYKINAALQLGGEEYVVEQVEDLLGVEIDNYVFLNYEGFRKVIDAIDGVDFYVPQDMFYEDPYQDLYINLKEGQQHLDGDKAEQLVRFRRYTMGDVKRTEVQRDFVMALYKQKLNSSLVKRIKTLVPAVMDFVDTDIGLQDALQYANFVKDFDENAMTSYQIPGEAQMINGASYFIADTEAIDEMFKTIAESHMPRSEEDEPFVNEFSDDAVDASGETIEETTEEE